MNLNKEDLKQMTQLELYEELRKIPDITNLTVGIKFNKSNNSFDCYYASFGFKTSDETKMFYGYTYDEVLAGVLSTLKCQESYKSLG